jgi:hypothetical protein
LEILGGARGRAGRGLACQHAIATVAIGRRGARCGNAGGARCGNAAQAAQRIVVERARAVRQQVARRVIAPLQHLVRRIVASAAVGASFTHTPLRLPTPS